MDDGIMDIPYAEFRSRLQACGLSELADDDGTIRQVNGFRFFDRPGTMGNGRPYYPIPYQSDLTIIHAPTIRHMLDIFGVPVELFMRAVA